VHASSACRRALHCVTPNAQSCPLVRVIIRAMMSHNDAQSHQPSNGCDDCGPDRMDMEDVRAHYACVQHTTRLNAPVPQARRGRGDQIRRSRIGPKRRCFRDTYGERTSTSTSQPSPASRLYRCSAWVSMPPCTFGMPRIPSTTTLTLSCRSRLCVRPPLPSHLASLHRARHRPRGSAADMRPR